MPQATKDLLGLTCKRCGSCKKLVIKAKEEDLHDQFYKDKSRKDGFSNHCIDCHKMRLYGPAQLQPAT